ncbi:MAG TPA: glycosyltransferase, partial [Chloroflexota bacterium]|nr:glycosyltransferase [Chloroflexota bacterium]
DALYPDIPGLTRRLGLEGRVRVVPRVDEADKPALYRSALLFCFPSAYEGFGLPPLEAMACGAPVLASSATSLPEVTGDAACLLPAGDVGAWARAIRALLESVEARARLRESGLVRAARFSWDRTAEQTAAVYREVLGR